MRVKVRQIVVMGLAAGLLGLLSNMAKAQRGGADAGGFGASYGYESGGERGGSYGGAMGNEGFSGGGVSEGTMEGTMEDRGTFVSRRGFGNFGYYGYPYGGDYWGPNVYYGSWAPGYDTYGYNYSSAEQSAQNTQTEQTEGKLPPVPTSKEVARFTDRQLQSFIAWVANGFTRELGQFSTGDTWVKYFRLDDLKALARQAPGEAATAQTSNIGARSQDVIDTVLERIDSAEKNSEYKAITGTWGFQALHTALKEAARSPAEREPVVLKGQAEVLDKSLERLSTGEGWRKHLELDSLAKLADEKNLQSNEEVQRIEDRFNQVMRNPEYQAIAQLPGFNGVYSTLHKLTEGKQYPSTAKKEASSPQKSTR